MEEDNNKVSENSKSSKNVINDKVFIKEKTKNTFVKEMQTRGCLGQISEIYDSKQPNLPKGTFAQGWSVAEVFRIIYEREI